MKTILTVPLTNLLDAIPFNMKDVHESQRIMDEILTSMDFQLILHLDKPANQITLTDYFNNHDEMTGESYTTSTVFQILEKYKLF